MADLTPFQKEIAQAVEAATGPMARQIEKLRSEVAALREGDTPEWLTVKEAAAMLGVTAATIRRRVKDGLYRTRREGGKLILIHRSEIAG